LYAPIAEAWWVLFLVFASSRRGGMSGRMENGEDFLVENPPRLRCSQ